MKKILKHWNFIVSIISLIMAIVVLATKEDSTLFWSLIIMSWVSGNAHRLDMIEEKIDDLG